jgi:ketosteroid isomerase-like protein
MSRQNVELVRGIYDSFAAGDVAAVLGAMSPDIVWNEAENFPLADRNPYIGPDAVAGGVFARLAADWDGFALSIDELLDAGDAVVATGRYRGTNRATGDAVNAQFVHIWRIQDGKAKAFQQFTDTLQFARAAGGR